MKVLVCNAGSTSLKFKLVIMPEEIVETECRIERIGSDCDSIFTYARPETGDRIYRENVSVPDYASGIQLFINELTEGEYSVLEDMDSIERVGFKTVLSKDHYGDHELDEGAIQGLRDFCRIAPAHNIPYLQAIETMRRFFPKQLFVGAFETAFHTTIPIERKMYGVPYEWYEKYGVRRYGYHGASHSYVASIIGKESPHYKAVSCHMGGSGSICAIVDGKSVNNSFGMSLQTGIIHSSRVGDIDWTVTDYLREQGMGEEELMAGMNKKGGLLGISGVSNDVRYIEKAAAEGNERARLALEVYADGIVRYIGAYAAEMNGMDYLAFTGGVGEHSSLVRAMVCGHFGYIGLEISEELNKENAFCISTETSRIRVLVIPQNEEIVVARRTYRYGTKN